MPLTASMPSSQDTLALYVSGGRGPPAPPPRAAPVQQVLQPSVKLRPFFWSKLPANKDNIWSRVQPPFPELEKGQMTALEHLFAQTATTVTPGRKKGAPDGMHSLLITMCLSVASRSTCCLLQSGESLSTGASKSCHSVHAITCTSNQCGHCASMRCVLWTACLSSTMQSAAFTLCMSASHSRAYLTSQVHACMHLSFAEVTSTRSGNILIASSCRQCSSQEG